MKQIKPKQKSNLKRILIQCVALLFLIYALADITVLQAFCGNESVGIPSSHHLSKKENDSAQDKKLIQENQKYFQTSHDQEDSQQTCDDDCCFCCSSHVVVSLFFIKPTIIKIATLKIQSTSYENKYPNSELQNLFRPPQRA